MASTPESIKKLLIPQGQKQTLVGSKIEDWKGHLCKPADLEVRYFIRGLWHAFRVFPLTPMFLTKLDTNFVQARCSNDGVLITKLKDNKKQGYEPYGGDSPLHPYDYPYFHKNIRLMSMIVSMLSLLRKENLLDFLPTEKCYKCDNSSDCWDQYFSDMCMFIFLPIVLMSPLFICVSLCICKYTRKRTITNSHVCVVSCC